LRARLCALMRGAPCEHFTARRHAAHCRTPRRRPLSPDRRRHAAMRAIFDAPRAPPTFRALMRATRCRARRHMMPTPPAFPIFTRLLRASAIAFARHAPLCRFCPPLFFAARRIAHYARMTAAVISRLMLIVFRLRHCHAARHATRHAADCATPSPLTQFAAMPLFTPCRLFR